MRTLGIFGNIQSIYKEARKYKGGDFCMVPPSPELREKIKAEIEHLRSTSDPLLGSMLRVKPKVPIGMNDGVIYPGDTFPIGTAPQVIQEAAANRAPLRGLTRIVVVLVEFSDKALTFPQQHYQDLFFSEGVLANGSVKEYFDEVTHGLVEIAGEVVGPYTLPLSLTEYAHGASGTGAIQPNARTMAKHAAEAANPEVDFSIYDNNQDNYVDAFIVLHAGKGAEVTGSVNDIWSHKWVLPGGDFNADGTRIYAYLTVPEDAKIGVCCHELGHLLFGFPDLYDTDYSSEGVGNWCIMGGGSWLGGGEVPAHFSAWCKLQQGWVASETPLNVTNFQIPDVKTDQKVYKLWKNGSAGNEYFLLENRQKTGYDRFLPGSGLLIWHVDDSISANTNEIHPKVALIQSDGDTDLEFGNNRGDSGDPYPGSSNNRNFDEGSSPNSNTYNKLDSCVRVRNISDSDSVMTADIFCQSAETPKLSWWQKFIKWLKNIFG